MVKIFKDMAGNILSFDKDRKLALRNIQGKLVGIGDTQKFLKKEDVKLATHEFFGKKKLKFGFIDKSSLRSHKDWETIPRKKFLSKSTIRILD